MGAEKDKFKVMFYPLDISYLKWDTPERIYTILKEKILKYAMKVMQSDNALICIMDLTKWKKKEGARCIPAKMSQRVPRNFSVQLQR